MFIVECLWHCSGLHRLFDINRLSVPRSAVVLFKSCLKGLYFMYVALWPLWRPAQVD